MDTIHTTAAKATSSNTPKQIFLSDFLDLYSLTRAERSYYLKHNSALVSEKKVIADWERRIKIKKEK